MGKKHAFIMGICVQIYLNGISNSEMQDNNQILWKGWAQMVKWKLYGVEYLMVSTCSMLIKILRQKI